MLFDNQRSSLLLIPVRDAAQEIQFGLFDIDPEEFDAFDTVLANELRESLHLADYRVRLQRLTETVVSYRRAR